MALKTTLALVAAALMSVWLLAAHVGRAEPKSQIDQIEVGRN